MKIVCVLLFLIVVACSNPSTKVEKSVEIKKPLVKEDILVNKVVPNTIDVPKEKATCGCSKYVKYKASKGESLSIYSPNDLTEVLKKYSSDSLKSNVKKIGIKLSQFDSFPKELFTFQNVKNVSIHSAYDNVPLDLSGFLNLTQLEVDGSHLAIDNKSEWLKRIKYITMRKSAVKGIKKLSELSGLKGIEIHYSGFLHADFDLENLSCLELFRANSYLIHINDENIDFSRIDASKLPCLKGFSWKSYSKGKGILSNIEDSNLEYLSISHANITKEEKERMKQFNKSLKSK